MNCNHSARFMLLFCCCICWHCTSFALEKHISLLKGMGSKLITVKAVSTGGYCDKSLKLELTNNSRDSLKVDIQPGLIFRPEDSSFQDLVVLGNEHIELTPEKTADITLQTFCGKSYAHSPFPNLNYHFLKMGDSNLVRTLKYVSANNVPIRLAQNGVWYFTNHHSIASIYSYDYPRESEDFAKYIAGLMKVKLPEYFIQYKTENKPGQAIISRNQTKLYAQMHWSAGDGFRNMHLVVFNKNGSVYKNIEADQIIDKLGYTVKVEFDPRRDPQGTYIVKVFDDAQKVWDQKTVVIEASEYDSQ